MSRIIRLKLKGFKSFANTTVINFEKGFNTVVGANGSGKSNVFDAMCFVLGRMSSKGLRADKLGNLVFNGGKYSKPAKEAEVSIFLSNENKELMDVDLEEIKISRIVKKSGQSQYYLNNNKVTRTEIVEVLKRAFIDPDGYNVILQGDIMKIVNMSTIERRLLIEEISDISGYEDKRKKGLKKLEKVEIDLKDADLLMSEKTKYLKELKSEKEAAEKYHKVKDDLRFNSLLLIKSKLIRNKNLKLKKEEELALNEVKYAEHNDKLKDFEEQIHKIDNEIIELEKSIEIKSHNDFISVTNKITSLESEMINLKEKKAEFKKQVNELKTKLKEIKVNIKNNKIKVKSFEDKIKILDNDKKIIEKQLNDLEIKIKNIKKNVVGTEFEDLDNLETSIDDLREKRHNKDLIRQDNAIQVEKLNTKLETLNEQLSKFEGKSVENKEQFNELEILRKKQKKLIVEIASKANKSSEIASKLNNLQNEYNNYLEDHSKLRMKVESQKDLMSTNKAVDSILRMKSQDSQIHGSVAELASVPEKYSMALETMAGKSLFNIVVETDLVAVKYINYLKEQKIGNATFLPLNKVNTKFKLDDSVLNKKGVIDYALNLIQFDSRYQNIFHLIFADTIVIEKIEDARNIGIGSHKMVTLTGDIVTKSGAMSGGFRSRKRGLGAFKDDKSVEKLNKLDEKLDRLRMTIDHLKDDKSNIERKVYDLRTERMEVDAEIAKLEKLLSIKDMDTDKIKRDIEAILSDKIVIESSLKKLDYEIKEFDKEILKYSSQKSNIKNSAQSSQEVFKDLNKFQDERDKIKEKLLNINSQKDSLLIQINNVLEPEIKSLEKIFNDSENSIKKLNLQIEEITINYSGLEIEFKTFKSKEKELSKDYKDFIANRDKFKENKKKIEEKYSKELEKFDKVKEKMATLKYAIGEFETLNNTLNEELELLYSQVRTDFMENSNNVEDTKEGESQLIELLNSIDNKLKNSSIDVKELQNKVNNLKSRINAFGSINMKAVEIYDKLNDEFQRLLEKREILRTEQLEILNFISEMDGKKKVKFLETFHQLKENFIKIFSNLSTKGEAELNLEDEDNLFETGVEIKVKLSKKNYLDIKSLSGGEKTITAIAFIFAVQEFNPASFYIFDEVDAALDIMNSENLGKLVRKYAEKAQYIVVSHSEYFIQSADAIYGVTMDKNKISGVVSLDLSNMGEYLDDAETPTN